MVSKFAKGLRDKLQIVQNKCICFCLFLGNRYGIRYKLLRQINWLPGTERAKQFIAVMVYKFSNSLSPKYMGDIFIKSGNTKRTSFTDESKLVLPFRKQHDYGKNCCFYFGANIWNNIDNVTKEVKACNNFKHIRLRTNFSRI